MITIDDLKPGVDLLNTGGPVMWLLFIFSVVATAIIIERLLSIRHQRILPPGLVKRVNALKRHDNLPSREELLQIHQSSPLGEILATAFLNKDHSREVMKEAIEERGRQVVHELERWLPALATIAVISPLLGLLGTVFGMIEVFSVISHDGIGAPDQLAGGISQAMFTTAGGLSVAIPVIIFHRYLRSRVDYMVLQMEVLSLKLVDELHRDREPDLDSEAP